MHHNYGEEETRTKKNKNVILKQMKTINKERNGFIFNSNALTVLAHSVRSDKVR